MYGQGVIPLSYQESTSAGRTLEIKSSSIQYAVRISLATPGRTQTEVVRHCNVFDFDLITFVLNDFVQSVQFVTIYTGCIICNPILCLGLRCNVT